MEAPLTNISPHLWSQNTFKNISLKLNVYIGQKKSGRNLFQNSKKKKKP